MNTEQAIAIFERAMRLRDPALLTPECCEIALSAMHEQAEKSRGREYCRGWDKRCGASYCPMCGKRL